MKAYKDTYSYSASDLILYMRSPFASWMSRLEIDKPELMTGIEKEKDPMAPLLAQKGDQHESSYLTQLIEMYGADNVTQIARNEHAAASTIKAMQAGFQVIVQAYLHRDNFEGYADFLIRQQGSSNLGDYYYQVWDTKLAKSTKPYFIIQLCCYNWMLETIQGKLPEETVIVLGDKQQDRHRLAAYYSYFLNLKQQFLNDQECFDSTDRPDPALSSDYGVWGKYAKQLLQQSDSLALVANIRKSQIKKLQDAGISSLSELANADTPKITGIASGTLSKLQAQAAIQLASRGKDKPLFKILSTDNGKGLSALPPESNLDVYFDIEGHPLVDGGLEYLWGVSYHDKQAPQGKAYAFKDWWAHTQAQEKLAFEGFIDWVYQRWQQDPTMHIYHYASYEITAITKLSSREHTRETQTAELLKAGVFIDLYKIVKSGLLIGEPKYSIKNVEHLYRDKRTTDVANGGESVVFYEHWREQGGIEKWAQQGESYQFPTNVAFNTHGAHAYPPKGHQYWLINRDNFDWTQWPELNDIRSYNIDDCESTLELAIWLRAQQSVNNISFSLGVTENAEVIEKTDKQLENEEKRQALIQRQQRLIDQFENDPALKADSEAKLLVSLIHFYDRERKPKIFSYFQRLEKTDEELLDNDTVIFDLSLTTQQEIEGKIHCVAVYSASQPIRKDKIATATINGTSAKVSKITFQDIGDQLSEISFIINPDQQDALQQIPLTLFGDEARINTDTLENRLCEITESYFESRELPKLLETVINQANPRFTKQQPLLPVTRQQYPNNDDYLNAIIAAVKAIDESCLCIQGPPGAGKTYTAKNVIKALVQEGKRIGIMSNSHAAIMNLLLPLITELPETNITKVGGYGAQKDFKAEFDLDGFQNFEYRNSMKFTNKKPYQQFQIIGATVYAFAIEVSYESPVDYLFVDEASQVALANLIAVSGAAKNVILMGDQMQLEQPIQGSHPDESGQSALEFMLQDHAVIPDEKGIFLERTYRMHPDVCQPLSEVVYEGKLQADEDNIHQAIIIPEPKLITKKNGILSIPVEHEGNVSSSIEEVMVVQQLIDELKTGTFIDKSQQEKPITDADILVVAPYNMQVNLLKEKLGDSIKVGTIDKFQGQEAPVVIISMAVSDLEDSPRGLDFIFDINRLNVGVSRAKALAIIVSNAVLEQCKCDNIKKIEKNNLYLRLKLNQINVN